MAQCGLGEAAAAVVRCAEQQALIEWMQAAAPRWVAPYLSLYSVLASSLIAYVAVVAFWSGAAFIAVKAVRCIALSAIAAGSLKLLARTSRPYADADAAHRAIAALDPTRERSFGFPSGHVAVTVAAAAVLYSAATHPAAYAARPAAPPARNALAAVLARPALACALACGALLMCVSRVYTGAHYVHDVAGGGAVGLAVAALELRMSARHARRDARPFRAELLHSSWWAMSLVLSCAAGLGMCLAYADTHPAMRGYEVLQGVSTCLVLLLWRSLAMEERSVKHTPSSVDLADRMDAHCEWRRLAVRVVGGVIGCVLLHRAKHIAIDACRPLSWYGWQMLAKISFEVVSGLFALLLVPMLTTPPAARSR